MSYKMAQIPVTLNVTLAVLDLSNSHSSGSITCINYNRSTHQSESICGLNPNCCQNERLLKITCSHVCCESGSISEMMQDRHVVATHY